MYNQIHNIAYQHIYTLQPERNVTNLGKIEADLR